MSTYNGRRGPNVSQYVRDLNAIRPGAANAEENFNMEDDLALFTNTQFFDFDSGQSTDFQAQPIKPDSEAAQTASPSDDVSSAPSVMGELSNLDFISGDFNFPEFANAYPTPSMTAFPDGAHNFEPIQQPAHGAVYGAGSAPQRPAQFPQSASSNSEKQQWESGGSQSMNFEEASRNAADEDKRRRNTAASARFRIKKKQREQALEKSTKEMTEKLNGLESKVSQLQTENKWLKNLLVEKNEGTEDIARLWKEFAAQQTAAKNPPKAKGAESSAEER